MTAAMSVAYTAYLVGISCPLFFVKRVGSVPYEIVVGDFVMYSQHALVPCEAGKEGGVRWGDRCLV